MVGLAYFTYLCYSGHKMSNTVNGPGFSGLGIAPGILQVLQKLKFNTPTPIQEQSIPVALDGKDLMGIAQTGTGKTLAFGIPLIQKLLNERGFGLVVVPTRELAEQVSESIKKVGHSLGIRTATIIGGESIFRQYKSLKANPHIVIGTPGRIIDHLRQKNLTLNKVNILVLDEADRMLDMGFAPQLAVILKTIPKERQTMLFSATMPEQILNIAKSYMKLPIRIEIARPGTTAAKVTQEVFFVPQESKLELLRKTLEEYRGSVLIFVRTKFAAKRLTLSLKNMNHTAVEFHSNRSLSQRRMALADFKTGKFRVLVATDIAARGIDVNNIEVVINYDLPANAEDYVHRIGRTARAGVAGHAISFARPNEAHDVRTIERLIRETLPVSKLPALAASPRINTAPSSAHHGGRRPPQRGRGGFGGNFKNRGNRFYR